MDKHMAADFSRTCEGCRHVEEEPGGKGNTVFRCFAQGAWQGYVVGNGRFLPYVPAWCPEMMKGMGDYGKTKRVSGRL